MIGNWLRTQHQGESSKTTTHETVVGDPEDEKQHRTQHDLAVHGERFNNKVKDEHVVWRSIADNAMIVMISADMKGPLAAKVRCASTIHALPP